MFQGTKRLSFDRNRLASFWVFRGKAYVIQPVVGSAGGMLIWWRKDLLDILELNTDLILLQLNSLQNPKATDGGCFAL